MQKVYKRGGSYSSLRFPDGCYVLGWHFLTGVTSEEGGREFVEPEVEEVEACGVGEEVFVVEDAGRGVDEVTGVVWGLLGAVGSDVEGLGRLEIVLGMLEVADERDEVVEASLLLKDGVEGAMVGGEAIGGVRPVVFGAIDDKDVVGVVVMLLEGDAEAIGIVRSLSEGVDAAGLDGHGAHPSCLWVQSSSSLNSSILTESYPI